jgi:hypothetical protein
MASPEPLKMVCRLLDFRNILKRDKSHARSVA